MQRFGCAVVTGASSGIGLELVRLLANRADTLVLVARRRTALEAVAASLSCKTVVLDCDLEACDAAGQLWSKITDQGLQPDLWVNNAGFGLSGMFLQSPLDREQAMVHLNVMTLMTLTKLAAQSMAALGRGTILNVSSIAGFQPGPGMAVYFASKSFVLSFSQSIDEELRGSGVRCLVICPGNTSTDFHRVAGSDRSKWMHRLSKMTAAGVARAALRQIDTGKSIVVPGIMNRLMIGLLPFVPRGLITRLSAKVLKLD